MRVSFKPLSRNRYRVQGPFKSFIVKKAQVDRVRRDMLLALRQRTRKARASRPWVSPVDFRFRIDYASTVVPPSYRCRACGATGCKLWFNHAFVLEQTELRCASCVALYEDKDLSSMDDFGRWKPDRDLRAQTEVVGWHLPAIPTEANDALWANVPHEAKQWWIRLPTFPASYRTAA